MSEKDNLLFKMARLLRNTDGLFPSAFSCEVGKCLLKLRSLECDRYDREVIGMPPRPQVEEDPEDRYVRLCREAGARLNKACQVANQRYSEELKEIEKEFSGNNWPWYKV